MAVGSEEVDNWFTINGVGMGEYAGWCICDGRNGTPDLRTRTIVGRSVDSESATSDFSKVGNTGGSTHVNLSADQIPAHAHEVNLEASSSGAHSHSYEDYHFKNVLGGEVKLPVGTTYHYEYNNLTRFTASSGEHTHRVSGQTDLFGNSQPVDVRSPYFVAVYIIYKGI